MFSITNLYKTLLVFILSELVLLILNIVLGFYQHAISAYIVYFMLFIFISFLLYLACYSWRQIDISPLSFFRFTIIFIQFSLYCFAIRIFFYPLLTPIYLQDLSMLSQYRYFFFSVVSLFGLIMFFLIIKYKPQWSSYFHIFTFPYLKEEIRLFLYSWNGGALGNICTKIIDLLTEHFWFRIVFFAADLIIFHLLRFLTILLLWHCIFFHGDFRIIFNLVPLLFVAWLLSFFKYYFISFSEGCLNYIRSLLLVSKIENFPTKFGITKITPQDNISFQLTDLALSKQFTSLDISNLAKEWYIQAQLSTYFFIYFTFTKYIRTLIFITQILAWISITLYFFFPSIFFYFFQTNYLGFFFTTKILGKSFSRSYATEVRRVLPIHTSELSKLTEGVHYKNHPSAVDPAVRNPDNTAEILYEGQPTHGKGSIQHPSVPLHPSKDLQGTARPQYIIPPTTVTYVLENLYDPQPMPNSNIFMNDPKVKENLAKCLPREEST